MTFIQGWLQEALEHEPVCASQADATSLVKCRIAVLTIALAYCDLAAGDCALEMHQVRYFVALCETLNFTRAAERCNVAQPSLTRAIRLLEDEFGGPLFNRERNNTHLTELGRTVEPHLREVLGNSQSARARAQAFFQLKSARLKLGVSRGVAIRLIQGALQRFAQAHPDTEIVLLDDKAGRLRDGLREGDLEIVLLPLRPTDIDDLHYYPIADDRMQALMRPDHPLAGRTTITREDLARESLLVRESCLFLESLERHLEGHDLRIRPRIIAGSTEWLPALVEGGFGVAITGTGFGVPAGLVGRPVAGCDPDRDISLATKRGRLYSPAVKAFVDIALRRSAPFLAEVA